MTDKSGRIARLLRRPKIVVPVLLAGGLLAAAFSLSDIPEVLRRIGWIPVSSLLWTLLLAAIYLVVKGVQFRAFLRELTIFARWRSVLIAYAVGELSLTLPLGIYAQNYVLRRVHGGDLYRSAAATTLMLALETALLLLVLAAVGLESWPWLRPLALALLMGLVAFGVGMTHSPLPGRWAVLLTRKLNLSVPAPVRFVRSLIALSDYRVIARHGYLSVLYVGALIAAFYTVAQGAGIHRLDILQAGTIYAFSLSVALIFGGVTSQVGVLEIAGMGAAQASGYTYSEGLAMLLGFRLVWTACIWVLGLPVVFLLRRELDESGTDRRQETMN